MSRLENVAGSRNRPSSACRGWQSSVRRFAASRKARLPAAGASRRGGCRRQRRAEHSQCPGRRSAGIWAGVGLELMAALSSQSGRRSDDQGSIRAYAVTRNSPAANSIFAQRKYVARLGTNQQKRPPRPDRRLTVGLPRLPVFRRMVPYNTARPGVHRMTHADDRRPATMQKRAFAVESCVARIVAFLVSRRRSGMPPCSRARRQSASDE